MEALKVEAAYFVDCICNDKKPFNDGVAGLRVVRMLEAADIRSSRKARSSSYERLLCIAPDVKLGQGRQALAIHQPLWCEIGDNTKIGAFVEIQKNASVGKNCKISSHTFVCEGVTIEDDVFHRPRSDVYQRLLSARDDRDGSCRPKRTGKWNERW